uniref:Large ribosomal subunit protein uL29m n=1 Tax=Phaeomonas parva TaxID=124430 RepID=A0A7S1TNE6_9STRA|mmetsp:Transcript_10583/g.31962  ORF Transcript_10583/g.31962 Transcript_10583/m.31962 type:complete len:120 (+) Transcript_10583:209-568(+)
MAALRRSLVRRGVEEFLDIAHQGADTITGRAWTAKELRKKSFDDLHKLWFVLYKEKNVILTEQARARTLSREMTAPERLHKVKLSMARLRHVVDDRRKVLQAARGEQALLESIAEKEQQ